MQRRFRPACLKWFRRAPANWQNHSAPKRERRSADSNNTMKATVQTLTPAVPAEKGWLAVYADLFKARLTFLVLLTTLVGFYIGFRGAVDYVLMLETLFGTALVASGASALNQLMEQ